jgi:ABC-type amino acid transport substrate-binding protein
MLSTKNKNGVRLAAVVFLAAALALVLPPSPAAAGTADTVRESGVMIVGVRAGYLPFSDATGEGDSTVYSGFDVDMARAIAGLIGAEARFVVVEPSLTVPMAAEGIIQVAPGLNHRMSWERVIDFSVTYLSGGIRALVPSSSGIYSLSSLRGKTIAVVAGTDTAEVQKKIPESTVTVVDSPEAGLALLADRKAAALVGDFKDLVNLLTESEKPASVRLIKEPIVSIPIAMGLPPDDGAWREIVDRALMDLWVSGRYAEIYETWFGKEARVRLPLDFTMEVWPK